MTDPGRVGRSTDRSGGGPTALVAAVLGLVAVLVLVAPVVLGGETPSVVQLMLLPVIAVVVGAVIRRQPGAVNRAVGTGAIGIGVIGAVALGALLWALVNGLGRGY